VGAPRAGKRPGWRWRTGRGGLRSYLLRGIGPPTVAWIPGAVAETEDETLASYLMAAPCRMDTLIAALARALLDRDMSANGPCALPVWSATSIVYQARAALLIEQWMGRIMTRVPRC